MLKELEELDTQSEIIGQELCKSYDIAQAILNAVNYKDEGDCIIPILEILIDNLDKILIKHENLGQNILKLKLKNENVY